MDTQVPIPPTHHTRRAAPIFAARLSIPALSHPLEAGLSRGWNGERGPRRCTPPGYRAAVDAGRPSCTCYQCHQPWPARLLAWLCTRLLASSTARLLPGPIAFASSSSSLDRRAP